MAKYHFLVILFILCGCGKKNTSFPGYVEARYTYVTAEASGLIAKLKADKGEQVRAKDVLVVLDDKIERANVQRAESNLQIHVNNLKEAESELLLSAKEAARKKKLFESRHVTEYEYDYSKDRKIEADIKYSVFLQEIQRAQYELDIERYHLVKRIIKAPKSGLIYDRFFLEGEYVNAGQPIFAILDPHEIKIIFYISEAYLDKVNHGQEIEIVNTNKKSIRAKIEFISSQAEFTPPHIFSSEYSHELSFRVEALPIELNSINPGEIIYAKIEEN